MRKILIVFFLVLALGAVVANAQDTAKGKYPNLDAAQSAIEKASAKIADAQKANVGGLGGHAGKAKGYLEEAGKEIKLAADAAAGNRQTKPDDSKKTQTSTTLAEIINASKHPHLAEAQKLVHEAHDRLSAAQKANEFDLGGHAAKAKNFLEQASQELKLAADQSDKS